ncbi:unnamed protein product [Discula destructiva]
MSDQLNFLVALAACVGSIEAIRQTQAKTRRQEHRSRRNNLVVHCPKSSKYSPMLEGRHVVLSGDKLYIDTGIEHDIPFGFPFAGYYLPYPDSPFEGLVTAISNEDPPVMNWVFVDKSSFEVKFGVRAYAELGFKGPFDCTRQDRRLTLGGWEGFLAVKEGEFWALYFDAVNDRLRSKLAEDTPVLEIELQRIEMRTPKPPIPVKQNLDMGTEDASPAAHTNGVKGKQSDLESPEVD